MHTRGPDMRSRSAVGSKAAVSCMRRERPIAPGALADQCDFPKFAICAKLTLFVTWAATAANSSSSYCACGLHRPQSRKICRLCKARFLRRLAVSCELSRVYTIAERAGRIRRLPTPATQYHTIPKPLTSLPRGLPVCEGQQGALTPPRTRSLMVERSTQPGAGRCCVSLS